MKARKLLLVEFITVDRFHRALSFPFMKGWAKTHGIETPWVRFGLRASNQLDQGASGIGLDQADRDCLARILLKSRPTHVLFDRRPAKNLAARAREILPHALLAYLAEDSVSDALPAVDHGTGLCSLDICTEDELGEWLSIVRPVKGKPGPGNLFEISKPDFGWTAANELARTSQPLPFVVCGRECSYNRPLLGNPYFRGVDLPRAGIRSGCAFCRRERGGGPWRTPPLELAERQLRAIRDTHPPFPVRPAIRISGEAPFFAIDEFARMLVGLDFPPGDFLFDARADQIVRRKAQLRTALRTIRGTGHRIHICLVGIENFSADELERLNKGTTPAGNLAAIALLLLLEREYPDVFNVREHGGLSMITFTPWTTAKDLLINTAIFHQLGLESLCGKFFTGRLRLYPELPLTLLARRDKLLIPRYRDPLLDTARRNFYPEEIPWRFSHPEIETANRIFTRLSQDAALSQDPLYARVQAWLDSQPQAREDLPRVAHGLATAVAMHSPARSTGNVLSMARDAMALPERGISPSFYTGNQQILNEIEGLHWSWDRIEQEAGLKPVRKIEALDAEHVALCRAHPELFRNLQIYEPPPGIPFPGQDIFFGKDRKAVAEAVELTSQHQWRGETEPEKSNRIVTRIGVLLGYPECCSREFAKTLHWTLGSNERLWLARRVENPGRIPVEMHPSFMQYVPCSTTCAPSAGRARRLRRAMAKRYGREPEETMFRELSRPDLILLDAEGAQRVNILPQTQPSERFRYRTGEVFGQDPRLRRVTEGDEMVLEPGCITVLRRGREHAYFPLNAFLWWREMAFHADFWRSCVALEILNHTRRSTKARAPDTGRSDAPSPESLSLKRTLSAFFSRGNSPARRFAGYGIGSLQPQVRPRLLLTLQKGRDKILLFIERKKHAQHSYLTAGDYAICFAEDTPLDSGEKKIAVRQFARYLAGLPAERPRQVTRAGD